MAQGGGAPSGRPVTSRHANLKKSFGVSIRPLLTACSREDVHNAFSTVNDDHKDGLHRLFIRVMKSLHENIEVEFESLCQETQVGGTLDIVEKLLEEQSLDILLRERIDSGDIKKQLSKVKEDEIYHLNGLIEKLEDQNNLMRARVASLKEEQEMRHRSIIDGIPKLKGCVIQNYGDIEAKDPQGCR